MANRTRDIPIQFFVTAEEKKMIGKKMILSRTANMGAYYAEDRILSRLEKNRHKIRIPQNASFKVRMFVQMTSYVADDNRTGFDHWAKKNNLKKAAKTFNYLSQHNLLNYEEFQNHISDLEASIHATDEKIQQTQEDVLS